MSKRKKKKSETNGEVKETQANRKQKQNKSYIPLIMFSLLEVIALQMQTVLEKLALKTDEQLGEKRRANEQRVDEQREKNTRTNTHRQKNRTRIKKSNHKNKPIKLGGFYLAIKRKNEKLNQSRQFERKQLILLVKTFVHF